MTTGHVHFTLPNQPIMDDETHHKKKTTPTGASKDNFSPNTLIPKRSSGRQFEYLSLSPGNSSRPSSASTTPNPSHRRFTQGLQSSNSQKETLDTNADLYRALFASQNLSFVRPIVERGSFIGTATVTKNKFYVMKDGAAEEVVEKMSFLIPIYERVEKISNENRIRPIIVSYVTDTVGHRPPELNQLIQRDACQLFDDVSDTRTLRDFVPTSVERAYRKAEEQYENALRAKFYISMINSLAFQYAPSLKIAEEAEVLIRKWTIQGSTAGDKNTTSKGRESVYLLQVMDLAKLKIADVSVLPSLPEASIMTLGVLLIGTAQRSVIDNVLSVCSHLVSDRTEETGTHAQEKTMLENLGITSPSSVEVTNFQGEINSIFIDYITGIINVDDFNFLVSNSVIRKKFVKFYKVFGKLNLIFNDLLKKEESIF